jgi:hypothetical protein
MAKSNHTWLRSPRRRRGRALMALAPLVAGAIALMAVGSASSGFAHAPDSERTSRTPPMLGVVGKDPNAKLVALDPRTLKRLPTPKPLPIRRCPSAGPCDRDVIGPVISPDGNQVAVVGSKGIAVVGRWRLRRLRSVREGFATVDPYGGEMAWAGRGFIFTGEGKFGLALYPVGFLLAATDIQGYAIRTRDGWAVISPTISGSGLVVTAFTPPDESAAGLALDWSSSVATYDARRNRLFVVSSSGEMAVVDMRTFDVAYRTVMLPPEVDLTPRFEVPRLRALTWAGQGTLVLRKPRPRAGVVPAGVWSIDIREGSSRLVDAAATDVRVSTRSIITWNREAATGIKVYEPGGALRFTAVPTRRVTNVVVTARHAYVDAGGRYSLDLRSGKVTGPLPRRARLVVPDLVDLP